MGLLPMRNWCYLTSMSLCVLALALDQARAHHSVASVYDRDQQTTLSGVITEFRFIYPHPYLTLEADAGSNSPQLWHLELDNYHELVDIGVTKETFAPGQTINVSGDRARNGDPTLYVRILARPSDGFRYEVPGFRPKISTHK